MNYDDYVLVDGAYGEEPFATTNEEILIETEKKQFVRSIERLIRTSPEYKKWLKFVHGVLGLEYKCYKTGEPDGACKIELHHYPLTLFDLVVISMEKNEYYTSFYLAEEVMSWHYKNYIGFIPLTTTTHQMCHNNVVQIPIDIVEGNWRDFYQIISLPGRMITKIEMASMYKIEHMTEDWVVKKRQYIGGLYHD